MTIAVLGVNGIDRRVASPFDCRASTMSSLSPPSNLRYDSWRFPPLIVPAAHDKSTELRLIQLATIDTAFNHRHSAQPSTQSSTLAACHRDSACNHRHSLQPSTQLATIDTACNHRHSIQPSTQSSTLPACHRDLSCSTRRHSYPTSTTSLVSRLPTTHDKHTKLLNP